MLPQTADAGLAVIDILADARIVFLIIYVNDLGVSTAFYERQLGLQVIESDENSVKLDAGLVVICLHRASDYGVKLAGRREDPSDPGVVTDRAPMALHARTLAA